jgi:hypothetical protein
MTDKAKRLGDKPMNPEMFFRENRAASEECPFEVQTYSGLTKREYFAAMAMQGLLTLTMQSRASWEDAAKTSVQCADALLEELSKTE